MPSLLTGLSHPGTALVAFCLWDMLERNLAAAYAWRCEPIEIPEEPTYLPADVSIVLATTKPTKSLARCLRLWLENKPKEIIIITIDRDLETVNRVVDQLDQGIGKIRILINSQIDHRQQQTRGIEVATGKIIFLVDDDTFCTNANVLNWLLAPFENTRVGAVSGRHRSAHISPERCNPGVSTPWEALFIRGVDAFNETATARFGADKGVWVLVGRVQAIRAGILHDPAFLHEYNHQTCRGVPLRTGDDTFITRWITSHGWNIAFQRADEAEVCTTPPRDGAMVSQRVRWLRNSHLFFLSSLLCMPGFFKMTRRHPYMARKMLERVLRPALVLVHFGVWVAALVAHPRLW
ncbi:hypothetical protein ACHAQA_003565 [Verticillium albo-atrum]